MSENLEKQDKILSKIGLRRHMVWEAPNYMAYDEISFTRYVSPEYLESQRKETDEVYRMFEIILLHKDTGLRIGYTTTESYDGEVVEYKLNNIFILTDAKSEFDVIDVDFKNEFVYTTTDKVSFKHVCKMK